MYLVGFLGYQYEYTQSAFLQLTAFNLWVTAFFLVVYHEKINKKAIIYFIFVALAGFFIEVLGVRSGKIFGEYQYGKTLGLKIFFVPISIGLNWLILTYCATSFSKKLLFRYYSNKYFIAFVSAIIMVILDVFIEPVAIKFDFWQWHNNIIPIKNYIGWFCVSFVLCFILLRIIVISSNKISNLVFYIQVFFFFLHNLVFLFH